MNSYLFCHQIRADELESNSLKWADGSGKVVKRNVSELTVTRQFAAPFRTKHVRLTWRKSGGDPIHACPLVASAPDGVTGEVVLKELRVENITHTGAKNNMAGKEVNFDGRGLNGRTPWITIDYHLPALTEVAGVRSDCGVTRPFTVHYSQDGVAWLPFADHAPEDVSHGGI